MTSLKTVGRGGRAAGAAFALLAALSVTQPGAPARAEDAPPAAAEKVPTAKELLAAMDSNMQFESRTATLTMEVVDAKRTRSYKMVTHGRGRDEAAIEYLEPDREKGTKMLKNGDNMWIYMPRAERVQKISGHMLRQGMMGSDISYEDILAQSDFEQAYQATVEGSEMLDGRDCWKMVAIARDETVTYPKRVMWVDKVTYMPLKQELYALSGMLLKSWTMSDIKEIQGKQVAMRMEIVDHLKQGSKTVMITNELQFGVTLEDEIFSMRWLERK